MTKYVTLHPHLSTGRRKTCLAMPLRRMMLTIYCSNKGSLAITVYPPPVPSLEKWPRMNASLDHAPTPSSRSAGRRPSKRLQRSHPWHLDVSLRACGAIASAAPHVPDESEEERHGKNPLR